MAYDGLIIKATVDILKKNFLYEHIKKINQDDNKNIELCIKKDNLEHFICISINPDFPNITYRKEKNSSLENKKSFCMLLRKHLSGGTIVDIKQIRGVSKGTSGKLNAVESLERIVEFEVRNVNDKGNIVIYHLICELMGRYSNILLCDEEYVIIDVLNKVCQSETTIRVLEPKKIYNTDSLIKKNEIYAISFEEFYDLVKKFNLELLDETFIKKMVSSFYGMSKSFLMHILFSCENKIKRDSSKYLECNEKNLKIFFDILIDNIKNINDGNVTPYIFYENNKPYDFHIVPLSIYSIKEKCNTITEMLIRFYEEKNNISFQNNLKNNLLRSIDNIIRKINKKIELNENDIELSKDYEKYKIYGELINTYGYDETKIEDNILKCINFYNGEEVKIELDLNLTISKNAEKYFNKYNKLKNKKEIANGLLKKNEKLLTHAINIKESLSYTNKVEDLNSIKEEIDKYFINNSSDKHKNHIKSNKKSKIKVHHYKSSSGIDIYVGMNNLQNEYLTFEFAKENDTWFHVKNATGSHVIVKGSYEDIDMKTIEEAASLAGYFSSIKNENKVTVDYTLRKELKKVKGAPPGFCIYHKNYSINVKPEVNINELKN